jgi:hypothetical protein
MWISALVPTGKGNSPVDKMLITYRVIHIIHNWSSGEKFGVGIPVFLELLQLKLSTCYPQDF